MHENGNTWWVHFQMTATSSSDICIALSPQNASELRFASTCRAPCSALGEPRHMNRKLTSSHGTPRRWEKFGSGELWSLPLKLAKVGLPSHRHIPYSA